MRVKEEIEYGYKAFSEKWHKDFIDCCIEQLTKTHRCYVYYKDDIKEIEDITDIPLEVDEDNETYTLNVPFEYQKRNWIDLAKFVYGTCQLSYSQIQKRFNISLSYYSKVNTNKKRPTDVFINRLVNMIIELGYEIKGNQITYKGNTLLITNQEVERIELTRTQKNAQVR